MDKTRYCKECFDRQEKIEQLEIELRVAKSQLEQIKSELIGYFEGCVDENCSVYILRNIEDILGGKE